jgi:hypothetical protein
MLGSWRQDLDQLEPVVAEALGRRELEQVHYGVRLFERSLPRIVT